MFKKFFERVLEKIVERYDHKMLNTFKQLDFSSDLKNIDEITISMSGDWLEKEITIKDSQTIEQIVKFFRERTDKWHLPRLGTEPCHNASIRFYRSDSLVTFFWLTPSSLSYKEKKSYTCWYRTISDEEYESVMAVCPGWVG